MVLRLPWSHEASKFPPYVWNVWLSDQTVFANSTFTGSALPQVIGLQILSMATTGIAISWQGVPSDLNGGVPPAAADSQKNAFECVNCVNEENTYVKEVQVPSR